MPSQYCEYEHHLKRIIDSNGYVELRTKEHILIAEVALGKPLPSKAVVHLG